MSRVDQLSEDDFEAAFNAAHGPASTPEREARERGRREKQMRSPHGDGRRAKSKGERVQFNRKMPRRLKDQVAAACKRHRISDTDALEQAFQLWLTSMGRRNA
jgi:hypothetical protein